MKRKCEDCGATPEVPECAEDDLVECHGCGKTICLNDCVWDSDEEKDLWWCFDCTEAKGNLVLVPMGAPSP
jgi:flavoprotein